MPLTASVTCPACNKADQSGPACQRCGCDLSALHRIVEAAVLCLDQARRAMNERDWQAALSAAERSWQLCHSAEAAGCAFLVAGALGDTRAALHWHRRATSDSEI